MKTLPLKILALFCALIIIHACEKSGMDEASLNEAAGLKSATVEKTSYIVVLNDLELNAELPLLKSFENKQEKVKAVSEKILKRAGITDGEIQLVYGSALQGFSVLLPPGQLKKLLDDPSVKSVTEDKLITLDLPSVQEVSATATQVLPWGIARVNGGVNYTGSHVIWIIDTGIDLDHPDLNVNVSKAANFVTTVSSPDDDNGHGTHCAGIAAAKNNSEGVIGVAAGAPVVPVKVLNRKGSGYYSWIIAGVNWVAGNGTAGDAANMSLGGSYYEALNAAIINASEKGILFSLAAGNESTDASTTSPASAEGENIYTISAMDNTDTFASFSNYGNPPVDFCEPGVNIYSTYKGGAYATMSGTSMAAPHMAGILLVTGGKNIPTDGTVKNDPDEKSDPIAVAMPEIGPTNQSPTASFTYSANELVVSFTDTSADPDGTIVSWNWTFGDGTTSSDQNPTHTYSAPGDYTVTLTVTDDDGAAGVASKTISVTSSTPNQPPVANFTFLANYLDVSFTDTSTDPDGTITAWSWNFGDGETSSLQNPVHTYPAAGTYTVSLTVTDNDNATNTATKTITVSALPVSVAPTFTNWSVANTSNPALKRVQINWSVADGNGDLKSVSSTLTDPNGKTVSTTTAVTGSSASGTHELSFKKGASGTYRVTSVVTDQTGKTDSRTGTINL